MDQLPLGEKARIDGVDGRSAVILRLMEMGLVSGARVAVRKRAPFGGPLELAVGDYVLSLRRAEAQRFSVALEKVTT